MDLSPGELAYVKDYRNPSKPTWAKASVIHKEGDRIYLVRVIGEALFWRRHLDQIITVGPNNRDSRDPPKEESSLVGETPFKTNGFETEDVQISDRFVTFPKSVEREDTESQVGVSTSQVIEPSPKKMAEVETLPSGNLRQSVAASASPPRASPSRSNERSGRPKRTIKAPERLNL